MTWRIEARPKAQKLPWKTVLYAYSTKKACDALKRLANNFIEIRKVVVR